MAAQIQDVLDSGIDISPTITPVLDTTNMRKQAQSLNALISRNQALSAYSNAQAAKEVASARQQKPTEIVNNYNMEQNNYSPKALSNIDIYRQTKNQISALKGVQSNAKIRYGY
jgi:hypothetical protein